MIHVWGDSETLGVKNLSLLMNKKTPKITDHCVDSVLSKRISFV